MKLPINQGGLELTDWGERWRSPGGGQQHRVFGGSLPGR